MGLTQLNDAVMWDTGKLYFFGDRSRYLRFDVAARRADPGYPKPIEDTWPGWPWAEAPTGAVEWQDGKAYFFHGYSYSCFDMATDRAAPGYPKPIEDLWPGMFTADVESAVNWGNGKAYFFSGDRYVRYDIAVDHADPGYPKPITAGWPGLWERGICAAVNWGNGKAYFFRAPGDVYVRWDMATDTIDPGFPRATAPDWPGLLD